MKKELIEKEVIEIIEEFCCFGDEILLETELDYDLGLDSLDMVEITMELEERFNISIEDEEIANVKTVSDIVELVVAKKVD
jgi:acyl carrier protein